MHGYGSTNTRTRTQCPNAPWTLNCSFYAQIHGPALRKNSQLPEIRMGSHRWLFPKYEYSYGHSEHSISGWEGCVSII